jgi:hypothetical protein
MNNWRGLGYFLLGVLCLSSCQAGDNHSIPRYQAVENQALAYFATYAERTDWEAFCGFYRTDMEFEDVLLQIKLDSLWQFQRFYNWPDTNFSKLEADQKNLVITSLVCNDSVALYCRGQRLF